MDIIYEIRRRHSVQKQTITDLLPRKQDACRIDQRHSQKNTAVEVLFKYEPCQHGGKDAFHSQQQRCGRGGRNC